jgi:hypothetical protein
VSANSLLIYGLALVVVIAVATTAGGLTAWCLLHRRGETTETTSPKIDGFSDVEWIDAELDRASVAWQEANGLPPEAASVMSNRLKTLHRIGTGRGWL